MYQIKNISTLIPSNHLMSVRNLT